MENLPAIMGKSGNRNQSHEEGIRKRAKVTLPANRAKGVEENGGKKERGDCQELEEKNSLTKPKILNLPSTRCSHTRCMSVT